MLLQRASMGCLMWCLSELVELVLLSAIGDDPAPRLPCLDLSIIESWRLHLDQYSPNAIDLYLRINLNFLVVFFILMPPPNSIDSTSSASSRTLESWTNPISETNCCVHNPGYHTYYDTDSWEIRRSPPTTTSTLWDRLLRAHKMNIKRYKKKNTQFNVVRPKLGLCPLIGKK